MVKILADTEGGSRHGKFPSKTDWKELFAETPKRVGNLSGYTSNRGIESSVLF